MAVNLQPTYAVNQPIALPGMPGTMTTWDADSCIVDKAAVANIGFGLAVSLKNTEPATVVIGGTAATFRGISVRDITLPPISVNRATEGYAPGENIGVMIRGDIWVTVTDAVLVTDVPKFVTTTGVFAAAGTILLPHARWVRPAGAGGLALLRLGMPNQLPDAT